MPEEEQNTEGIRKNDDQQIFWQILVSDPLNKDADVLVRWSRTSFFGGSPVSKPIIIDGREYALFQKCSERWTVKYLLSTATSNFRYVKLLKHGEETSLEPYLKDVRRTSGKLLGDADTMGRSGGMC